jgi:hypothetical protein
MGDWSEYPNFIDLEQLYNRADAKQFYKETKQLCSTDRRHFNVTSDRAAYVRSKKWPSGSTIRIKFLDGEEWKRAWVKKIVEEEIQPHVGQSLFLQFVDTRDFADVKITFKHDGPGASLIGTDCRDTPQNSPSMKFGPLDFPESRTFQYNGTVYTIPETVDMPIDNTGSVIKHEFGHVFGLLHEHQNPTNNPIRWDAKKVLDYYLTPPTHMTREDVQRNLLDRYPADKVDGSPFDPLSIMLYAISPELTVDGIGFRPNRNYSPTDLYYLKYAAAR